jgi:hypothetical protein
MMRQILYRGKRDDGKWCYGHVDPGIFIQDYEEYCDKIRHQIVPETVGQYTGLDDKNGVKIFKGDIVKTTSGYGGVFSVEWSGCAYYLGVIMLGLYASSSLEVVGNIHDNPELLEEGK